MRSKHLSITIRMLSRIELLIVKIKCRKKRKKSRRELGGLSHDSLMVRILRMQSEESGSRGGGLSHMT